LVVMGSLLRDVFWATRADFGTLVIKLLTRLALALSALAVIDTAFARAAFFRALWQTRREYTAEQREAYGSPELRAARERVRHESAREESV
jgi:type III secretory pathway component EscU